MQGTSLAALRPEEYAKRRSGCVEVDRGRWLGEARKRYDAFVHRQSGQDAALEQEIAGGAAGTVEDEHAGAGEDGDDDQEIAESLSDCAVGVCTSEFESDDERRAAVKSDERLAAAWNERAG